MKKFKFLIFLIVFCVIVIAVQAYIISRRENQALSRYCDTVTKYSFKYNVDANLVYAVIKAESNFNEDALSSKGAIGLMQILPSTGLYISQMLNEDFNVNNLYSFTDNIKYGTYYLNYLFGKFNDLDLVIAAYNAGEGNVYNWLELYSDDGIHLNNIPFKETKNYLEKVKNYYSKYKNMYNY